MLISDAIRSAVQKLVAAAQPSRVILFGSYARGEVPGTVIYWALQEGKTLHDARA